MGRAGPHSYSAHFTGYFKATATTSYQFFIQSFIRSQCSAAVWFSERRDRGRPIYAQLMVSLVAEEDGPHPHLGRFANEIPAFRRASGQPSGRAPQA